MTKDMIMAMNQGFLLDADGLWEKRNARNN